MTTGVCRNCGDEKQIHGKGLCKKCYEYQRKHGTARPLDMQLGGKQSAYTNTTCRNCGAGGKMRLGMCVNCYAYQRNHDGAMRPLDKSVMMAARRKHTHCRNCGIREHKGHGLCSKCYEYLRHHGKMRPTEAQPKGICVHCKQARAQHETARHGLLCHTCANYLYHTGKPRPHALWVKSCITCGKPHGDKKPRSGMCTQCRKYRQKFRKRRKYRVYRERCKNCNAPFNGYKSRKGRCRECQEYKRKYPKKGERPAYLWGVGDLGWCDCGNPAMHEATITVGSHHTETFALCNECYAEHQRQVQWYGGGTHDGKRTGKDSSQQPRPVGD